MNLHILRWMFSNCTSKKKSGIFSPKIGVLFLLHSIFCGLSTLTSGFLLILSSFYQSVANRKYNFCWGIVEQCFRSRIIATCEQPIHSFPHFHDDYLPNFITHWNTSFQQVTINDTHLYWKKWGPQPTSSPLMSCFYHQKPQNPGIDPKSNHSFLPHCIQWLSLEQKINKK